MATSFEIIPAILFFSNYALAAIAIGLSIVLYRHYHQAGWLVLGAAFLSPYIFLALRLIHGQSLLTYRTIRPGTDGIPVVTYNMEIPGFYLITVAGLLLLIREARRGKRG